MIEPSMPKARPVLVVDRPLLSIMPASISRISLSPINHAAMHSGPHIIKPMIPKARIVPARCGLRITG